MVALDNNLLIYEKYFFRRRTRSIDAVTQGQDL
ncbi:MAG: hypothetical protein ACI8TV_000068 [Porticoccaceae bacterium]|jgi:hypothetical protein